MLKNTKLKTQILLVCSFPIICLLILSSLIYKNAVDSFQMQMEAQEAETTILEASYMAWGIGRVVRNVRGYLLFPDDQTYKESYDEGLEMFRQAYADLNQHVKSPQRRQQIDLLLSEGEQNVAISEQVFRLVDAGQLEAAKSQIRALRMKAVDDTRDEIIKSETAVLSRTRQALAQAQYRLMASVVLGTLVAVAGSAMLSLWLVRWITRQIAEVVKTAEQISVGNLTAEVTVDAASQNELDQLLNTFQVMIDNLNLLVCQVQRSGLQATTSVTQIAASGRQLEATVTEQVASTHEVVATAKQIAITANELAYTLSWPIPSITLPRLPKQLRSLLTTAKRIWVTWAAQFKPS
jgi:methyl-accepting chemotaxis protein WspA